MGCFPCFSCLKGTTEGPEGEPPAARPNNTPQPPPPGTAEDGNTTAKAFTFRELASATKNFREELLLTESGIGRVFKGTLQPNVENVAVRQLDRSATPVSKEFQAEVSKLSLLHHPNLVKIIGYCTDGDQRLVVYEYMGSGSLEVYLFDLPEDKKPLDWSARMKIASGIAEGLGYLHETANPPIVYRSLKSSNVLLDEANTAKLSEYGLAKLLQNGNKTNPSSPNVISTFGYSAPECDSQSEVTTKSDVYTFGVVLLELITGRRAYDSSRPAEEQSLVSWAKSFFGNPKKFPEMVDPRLGNDFPTTALNQAVGVASMCIQEEPTIRPLITDVVPALSFLAMPAP